MVLVEPADSANVVAIEDVEQDEADDNVGEWKDNESDKVEVEEYGSTGEYETENCFGGDDANCNRKSGPFFIVSDKLSLLSAAWKLKLTSRKTLQTPSQSSLLKELLTRRKSKSIG